MMTPQDQAAIAPAGAATPGPARKTCPQCKVSLLLSAFARNATSLDGVQSTCRECQRVYRANWAVANKDRVREQQRNRIRGTPKRVEDAQPASNEPAAQPITATTENDPMTTADTSAREMQKREGEGEGLGDERKESEAVEANAPERIEPPTKMAELQVSAIVASPTNPRRHFHPGHLQELADSIRLQGLAQPILVRPLPGSRMADTYSDRRADAPRPTHEIIAGERRWRACQMVGVKRIPVLIRDLDDAAVLQLQLVENLKRADLHPMEEAEGYERLRREIGMTPDEIAERIGKGKSYVYNTLQLLELEPEARDAFYDGKLNRSTAELVAKRPPNLQIQLLREIIAPDFHGDPWSFRKVKAFIEDRYMLRLTDAPFNTTDPTLVPAAGGCPACPKRTGASPELFEDVGHRDTCTDTDCFAAKKVAHYDRIRADAEAKGITVLVGKEAREIMPTSTTLRGYVRVDDMQALNGQMRTLRAVMGADMPKPTMIEDPSSHELIAVLPTTVVGELLRKQGISKTDPKETAGDIERRLVTQFESTWRMRAIERVFAQTEQRICGIGADAMREIAQILLDRLGRNERMHVCKLLSVGTVADLEGIRAALREYEPGKLESLLLLLLMQQDVATMFAADGRPNKASALEAVARDIEVDTEAVRAEVRAEIAQAIVPSATPTASAAPAGKPARKGKTTAAEASAAIAASLQALEDQSTSPASP